MKSGRIPNFYLDPKQWGVADLLSQQLQAGNLSFVYCSFDPCAQGTVTPLPVPLANANGVTSHVAVSPVDKW